MDIPASNDPRVFMAAERTFLSWVRTGVALMGFGFVMARFGLFLREIPGAGAVDAQARHALSIPIGIALVVLGIVVTGVAAVRHGEYVRALRSGTSVTEVHSRFPYVVAATLVAVVTLMAAYLVLL